MSTAKKTDGLKTFDIDHQEASVDIWDKKYRLKDYDANPVDVTIDDTFKRVAKALSEVEETDKKDQTKICCLIYHCQFLSYFYLLYNF